MLKILTTTLALVWSTGVAVAGDAALFAAYDQANSQDIQTAELGAVRGHNAKVRELAVMVLRDHSGVRQMARDIAQDAGVSYESGVLPKSHTEAFAKLSSLEGAAFDEAYLRHEAAFHSAAMAAVRDQILPAVKEPEFAEHLKAVLPHFEHHLAETLATAKALGYQIP